MAFMAFILLGVSQTLLSVILQALFQYFYPNQIIVEQFRRRAYKFILFCARPATVRKRGKKSFSGPRHTVPQTAFPEPRQGGSPPPCTFQLHPEQAEERISAPLALSAFLYGLIV